MSVYVARESDVYRKDARYPLGRTLSNIDCGKEYIRLYFTDGVKIKIYIGFASQIQLEIEKEAK